MGVPPMAERDNTGKMPEPLGRNTGKMPVPRRNKVPRHFAP
jgi:hypothetical protein